MGHILRRLTVFAVNTGIWPATFALLTVILVCVVCRSFARYTFDQYASAACFSEKYALRRAVSSTVFGFVQHAACQPKRKRVYWWRGDHDAPSQCGRDHKRECGGG